MKVYAVRPEYAYNEQLAEAQQAMLDELGLTFGPLRTVFCSADQALALLAKGFCGTYCNHDAIQLVYDTGRN